jgi:Ni2+-binding GTPase involved in maturation of urease and hydrogenase
VTGSPSPPILLQPILLQKNDLLAQRNRGWFSGREILALNLVSAPGAGKTTLLERTIRELKSELPLYVIEGEDKPVKYPHMFRAAQLVLPNKIDLLPHLDFDMARAIDNLRAVNPTAAVLGLSARTGEGMTEWYEWLRRQMAAARESAFT